jgi:ubiquinone/menaquinone biosynthesis C-methylase UbiE/uncharacterized protein YbaR (Trm112 family)
MTEFFACPLCKGALHERGGDLVCDACVTAYARKGGVTNFITRRMYDSDEAFANAMSVIDFWGHGWQRRLAEEEHVGLFRLTGKELAAYADQCLDRHRRNQSFMVDMVAAPGGRGRTVLNIGCGSGSEALVIANSGAACLAVDITAEAAAAAAALIANLGAAGAGMQADARFLPVRSDSVDAVYSSGVLHHSPDIAKSVSEVHRVLKPGGKAYVMLYATWSINFMQPRLLGFLRGNFSRSRQHRVMSEGTESDWRTGARTNPHTVTFTRREATRLFTKFREVRVEKRVFSVRQFMLLGRVLQKLGLVAPLDRGLRFLNPLFGACLFIVATK